MPNSTILQIADAVKAHLEGGAYVVPHIEMSFARLLRPSFDLTDLTKVRISVVPKAIVLTPASRSSDYFDCAIDVGVQKKIDQDSDIDTYLILVEQFVDRLRHQGLPTFTDARYVSIVNEPVFAPEHIDERRAFTSVITATYRVAK